MRTALSLIAVLILCPGVARAQEKTDPEQAYYRAFYQEQGLRDFAAAEVAYRAAADAAKAADREDLLVRCLLGRGRSLAALGRRDEAKAVFGQVLDLDPDNSEARKGVGNASSKPDDDLDLRVLALVQKLDGPERNLAKRDLKLIGDRAVPALAEGLRSGAVGIVEGSAQTLADMGTTTANATLAAAFSDPEVRFPNALASALDKRSSLDASVYTAALRAADSSTQIVVMAYFRQNSIRWTRGAPAAVTEFLRTALGSGEESVVASAIQILGYSNLPDAVFAEFGEDFWAKQLESKRPTIVDQACRALGSSRWSHVWTERLGRIRIETALRFVRGELPGADAALSLYSPRYYPEASLLELYAALGAESCPLDRDSVLRGRNMVLTLLKDKTENEPGAKNEVFQAGWPRIADAEGRQFWLDFWTRSGVSGPNVADAAVADSDEAVRIAGYQAWQQLLSRGLEGDTPTFPHLIADIGSADSNLASTALYIARRFEVAGALPAVRELLAANGSGNVRASAIRALGALAGTEAVPELRGFLADDDWETARDELVRLLGVDAVPDLLALATRLEDGFRPLTTVSNQRYRRAVSEEVIQAYVDALPPEIRRTSLLSLPQFSRALRPDQLRMLVKDALARSETAWKMVGASTAGQYHLAEAWPTLLEMMDRPEPEVQQAARKALEEIRTYLDLKASFTRYGQGGPADALAKARELTESESPTKRRAGALAIGALGDPAGVADLIRLLDDPDESVRTAALDALARLGGAPEKE